MDALTPEKKRISWESFDRYMAGEATVEEAEVVRSFIAKHPDAELVFSQRGVTARRGDPGKLSGIDDAWNDMLKRIGPPHYHSHVNVNSTHATSCSTVVGSRPSRNIRRVWQAAVMGLVAVALLVTGWYGRGASIDSNLSDYVSTYTTAEGKQATITLPDGSTVLLNVASRLEVPANFITGNRTLNLEGEALFSVVHRSGTPFTVVTESSVTRVLGTKFAVRKYRTDSATIVAVHEGRVAVDSVVVNGGEQVLAGTSSISGVFPLMSNQLSFASGILSLKDVMLPDAIIELNRWYDADIRIADDILSKDAITGDFTSGSLSDLVEIMEGTLNIRAVRSGRILTLYSR